MGKRFDSKSAKLLKMLGQTNCLDDLFAFEVKMPKEWRRFQEIGLLARAENRKLTPAEEIEMAPLRAPIEKFFEEIKPYRDPNRIAFSVEFQVVYDSILDTEDHFESAMDAICLTKKPTAYYIPSSTSRTIMDTKKVLADKLSDLLPDLPNETGILLVDSVDGVAFKDVYLAYHISPRQFSGIIIHEGDKLKKMLVTDVFHIDFSRPTEIKSAQGSPAFALFGLLSVLFIHFFETEKVIAVQPVANTSRFNRATLNDEHYDSNITYPVNVVDAHWFTTIVKNDPFLVRGHFRRQPYGPGRGQFKIRWIAAFMKTGYKREAKHEVVDR